MTDLQIMVKEMNWTTRDIVKITGTSLRSAQRFIKDNWAPEAEMRLLKTACQKAQQRERKTAS